LTKRGKSAKKGIRLYRPHRDSMKWNLKDSRGLKDKLRVIGYGQRRRKGKSSTSLENRDQSTFSSGKGSRRNGNEEGETASYYSLLFARMREGKNDRISGLFWDKKSLVF